MRDYGKVSPKFWIGATGKKLRKAGACAQIVGLYLQTGTLTNMLGLYYLPMTTVAHETGLGMEGAYKGLARCIEAQFCAYDEAKEMVWVFEMAKYQIADSLKPEDRRCAGIQNDYDALPENPYLEGFFDKYAEAFHLTRKRQNIIETPCPIEGAYKALPSQEQEQEQEHKQEQAQEQEPLSSSAPPPSTDVRRGTNSGETEGSGRASHTPDHAGQIVARVFAH